MTDDLGHRGVKVFDWIRGSGANLIVNMNPEDWYAYAEGYKLGAGLRRTLARPGRNDPRQPEFGWAGSAQTRPTAARCKS